MEKNPHVNKNKFTIWIEESPLIAISYIDLNIYSRDYFGVLPLKGKCLNAKN